MIHKRTILLTENEQIIFRHDNNNINGKDYIEKDLFNALIRMNQNKQINLEKLFNLLKIKYGLTISDTIGIMKDTIKNDLEKWKV